MQGGEDGGRGESAMDEMEAVASYWALHKNRFAIGHLARKVFSWSVQDIFTRDLRNSRNVNFPFSIAEQKTNESKSSGTDGMVPLCCWRIQGMHECGFFFSLTTL